VNSEIKKNVEFNIHRYDPQQKRHYVSRYNVPVKKGMTLLEALTYIKDNLDGTLAFRHSCRMGVCGSCGIMVNGQPMLACYTQVLHLNSNTLNIEPLQNMSIIKDLIVDIQPFFDAHKKIKPILIKPQEQFAKPEEFNQMPKELRKYWDLTLCIKCSICYSACPAAIDERFLGPSTYAANYRFLLDTRDEGSEERLGVMTDNVWLCTSCNSCTLFCPKEVDSSGSIVDERSQIVETGEISKNIMDVLTSSFKYHNPMGMHQSRRMDWAKDLNVKTFPSVTKSDVLYFVCCQTAYDPRNQQIANSMATLLDHMEIDYATLGVDEWCCGDHQLRLGEKGLFEILAQHNLSMFEKFTADKVVTLSPHCYDTFKNDKLFRETELQVQHYTQFLADALSNDKLRFSKSVESTVTYHDPCFLGKRNKVFDAPREILQSIAGLKLVEMKRTRENSFCCGGGAGRVWIEEAPPEKRPSVNRVKEALDLDVEIIATSCPFCVTTLEDATKVLDVEDKIVVKDILELLKDAL
jgi:succinate dehydrogenase/fumarate reductase iron-sulfur protein